MITFIKDVIFLIEIIDILLIINDEIKLRNAELRIYNFFFKRELSILIRLNNLIKIILNINEFFFFKKNI